MKEPKVKQEIHDELQHQQKTHGDTYYFMPPANGYGRAGIPDFVVCVSGTFVAFEAKGEGGKTTALQDRELQRINDAGGIALVVTHKHDVRAVVAATCDMARVRRNQGETE